MESVSRRAWLWSAFAVVHLIVAWLGFALPNQPMGDVYLVYEPWALQAVSGAGIPGIASPWIYPQLAIVPMVLALGIEWIAGYEIAWAILMTAVDAVVFAMLVGRGRSRGRARAAWFWLAFALALGPVGMYRLDGLTAAIALAGCLWLVGRPWVASVLLAIVTWIKVWPAALLVAAFTALRRRGRDPRRCGDRERPDAHRDRRRGRRATCLRVRRGTDRPRTAARGSRERVLPVASRRG